MKSKAKNVRLREREEFRHAYRKHKVERRYAKVQVWFEEWFEYYAKYLTPIVIWGVIGFAVVWAFVTVVCVK